MPISKRSKLSLCQLLMLFRIGKIIVLLEKHDLDISYINEHVCTNNEIDVRDSILEANSDGIEALLDELARTHKALRTEISPRYRFDERWHDLQLCLELDGYRYREPDYDNRHGAFVPIEPLIEGVEPIEDDLLAQLRDSDLGNATEIIRIIENSADSFLRDDFNGCLANARVALQTLAGRIAEHRITNAPGKFDPEKWGQVIGYLRKSGFINEKHEEGLTGVFTFVSPGSHCPIGFENDEFARLGRNLALGFCYFLIKLYNAD